MRWRAHLSSHVLLGCRSATKHKKDILLENMCTRLLHKYRMRHCTIGPWHHHTRAFSATVSVCLCCFTFVFVTSPTSPSCFVFYSPSTSFRPFIHSSSLPFLASLTSLFFLAFFLVPAAGKSTYLAMLEERFEDFSVVQEPVHKWTSVRQLHNIPFPCQHRRAGAWFCTQERARARDVAMV